MDAEKALYEILEILDEEGINISKNSQTKILKILNDLQEEAYYSGMEDGQEVKRVRWT